MGEIITESISNLGGAVDVGQTGTLMKGNIPDSSEDTIVREVDLGQPGATIKGTSPD